MARHRNLSWDLPEHGGGLSWEQAQMAVLMDIREQLFKLNRVFECPNFLAVPQLLRDIKRNTTKPRRRRKQAA